MGWLANGKTFGWNQSLDHTDTSDADRAKHVFKAGSAEEAEVSKEKLASIADDCMTRVRMLCTATVIRNVSSRCF